MSAPPTSSGFAPLVWTDELVATLWEYYASERPDTFFTAQVGDQVVARTARFLPRNGTICDFGCGSGHLLKWLLPRWYCAGVDPGKANLARARSLVGHDPNLIGLYDLDAAASLKERFDAAYFVEVIEHLSDRQIDETLARLRSLLKAGGLVVCTTPNEENLLDNEVVCPVTRLKFHRFQHLRSLDASALSSLFSRNGFTAVATFTTDFTARSLGARAKLPLRRLLGRKLPHLVHVAWRA